MSALAVVMGAGLTGCSSADCLPSPLDVTVIESGGDVSAETLLTIQAPGVDCDLGLGLGDDREYWVTVLSGDETFPLGRVVPAADGSFSATFLLPNVAHTAGGRVEVEGSPYDECRDVLGDCVGYGADLPMP
ncbi:hypothetical protein [Cryobacterium sp. BB736]|uniref:hypothetical protein n=1 Tax=Cryobacterium sp. BB736 TaxID=2746963 RepID=UPI001873F479|nr:hypothetical protein [Cryobacterium sp. BB736]